MSIESYRKSKLKKPEEAKESKPIEIKPVFRRTNGFQKPMEIAQLSTWFFFGLVAVLGLFDAIVEFYDQLYVLLPLLALFFIFFCGTWYYGYQAHKIDPASEVLPVVCPEIDREGFRRCYSGCEGWVKCGSYHCRKCNKCSEGFDHHCLWLNNCIGSKNYFEFFMTLVYVDIYLTIWNGIGTYTFVRFFTDEGAANERWSFMGGKVPVCALVGTVLVVTIVFAALVLQLMIFHGILIWRGTATVNFLKGETGESDEFGAKLLRLCSFAVNGMACKIRGKSKSRKRAKVIQAPPDKSEIEMMEEGVQRQPPGIGKSDFAPPHQPNAKPASAKAKAAPTVAAPKPETSSTTDESK